MTEKVMKVGNGLPALIIITILFLIDTATFVLLIISSKNNGSAATTVGIIATAILIGIIPVFYRGLFTLQPNEAAVLILFGEYKGTVKDEGWNYTNPFYTIKKISMRS